MFESGYEKLSDSDLLRYRRAKIVLLTGWTFDQVRSSGLQDIQDLLAVHDAQQKL